MKCLLLGGTGYVGKNLAAKRPEWDWTLVGSQHADLTVQDNLPKLYGDYDIVVNCAGFYGGIPFNTRHQQEILFRNSLMITNVSKLVSVIKPKKFVNIGSGCIYPKTAQSTLTESQIGPMDFHPTIQYSGLSKMWALRMTEVLDVPWEYLALSNIYGPGEHLEFERSHLIGSVINKITLSDKTINMIGTGEGIRDFIYIDDAVEAISRYCELETATCSVSNISTGTGVNVKTIIEMLLDISKKNVKIQWGDPKDNGVLYKVLDNTKMLNDIKYNPGTPLQQGLEKTWHWFQHNKAN
jgi:GDP-L-fucose synthase